jgi:hypothetical protein
MRATTLLQTSPQLEAYTQSYGPPKSWETQFQEFREFGEKMTLGAGPVARHKEFYKGEGGGFPQVWAMVNLVSPCLPVARLCTKSVPTMH